MTDALSPSVLAALTRIGIVLAQFVWQGAVIAAVLAMLMRILRTRSPSTRYMTLVAGMTLMAASPVISLLYCGHIQPPPAVGAELVLCASANQTESLSTTDAQAVDIQQPSPVSLQAKSEPAISYSWTAILADTGFKQALCIAALLWAAGVMLLAIRLTFGWLGLYRLRRRGAEPLPSESAALVSKLCDRLGLANVRVFTTRAWNEPVAFGLLRPVVLVPMSVLMQCPPELVEAIIAHELAHIRRYDLWVNLLQRIVETLLFYHPAVWWVSGRIRAERELCCDDLAVSITRKRADYASALVEISRIARGLTAPPLAAGLIGSRLSIVDRARRVLGMTSVPSHSPRVSFWIAGPLALALAGTIGLFAANSSAAPSAASQPSSQTRIISMPASSTWRAIPGEANQGDGVVTSSTVVRSLADGIVLKVLVTNGQEIKAGTPIINLDDEEIILELRAAQSKLDAAKEASDDAQREMKAGAKPLSFTNIHRLEQDVKMAEIDVQRWQLRLTRTRVLSPAAGKVMLTLGIGPGAKLGAGDKVALVIPPNSEPNASPTHDLQRPQADMSITGRGATPGTGSSEHSDRFFPLRWYAGPEGLRDYELRSPGDGVIAKIHARPGEQVQAGDLIAELDNEETQIELEAARVHLDSARRQLEETTERVERGLAPTSERTKAQETFKLAELDIKRLELRLARTMIKAPVSGKLVTGAKFSEGTRVTAGDEVARIRALPATQPERR